jgi:NAD(P)-dependent dehydrogenase (short-subunit alcohol dehydrogenase family)
MQGRRVIVTGAASGMGKGIAELFAAEGAALALFDRDAGKLEAVAKAAGAQAHVCDVSDAAAVEAEVGRAVGAMGGLDGMVNAAGILITKAFDELTLEDFNRMIGVNLVGPFNMIKAALPALSAAPAATIVNVASASGYFPTPGISGYGATKGGLIMFAKGLALDLGPQIRVNTICPGVIKTEMTRYLWENPEHSQRAIERNALKRLGTTDDIARTALFLSTEDSGYTTGTEILVDGGFTWR